MMHIVCCADENYTVHFVALVQSFLRFHAPDEAVFYLIHSRLSDPTAARLHAFRERTGIRLVTLPVEDAHFAHIPEITGFSRAIYFRLLIPALLPATLDKALYLDVDILLNGSLRPLWETDLGGYAVAAVQDAESINLRHLGNRAPAKYFNSGMLLINLKHWRENRIMEKTLEFAAAHGDALRFPDQDTLNVVLENAVRFVDPRWNFLPLPERMAALKKAAHRREPVEVDPVVVHFAARRKPWSYRCRHPFKSHYWRYLRQTPWRDYPMQDRTLGNMLMRFTPKPLRRLLAKAGIGAD